MSDQPSWLVAEPYTDVDHGVVKSGKEAQVDLVERIGDDGRSCLIARKRYLPRHVTQKGQLEAMGVQRSSAFRHDVQYREGRQFRKSRDRRAIERMSTYGRKLLQDRWTGTEHEVMSRLWHAGVPVPFPIAFADDGDLSAYNLLWWEERLWFIDFPQSIDIAANLQGLDFLHRDVLNVADWFDRRGFAVDAEELFADLLSFL